MPLTEVKSKSTVTWTPIEIDPAKLFGRETLIESSGTQREIFGPSLLDADASRAYNHSISVHFEGNLDIDALYSTMLNLLDRHEALRGSFSADGSQFRVREHIGFELPIIDLSTLSEADQKRDYDAFVRQELNHTFDLVNGPLFRASLLKFGAEKWSMVFNCHHVVVDGWSLKIILDDLPKLYSALVAGLEQAQLPAASSFVEYMTSSVAREKDMAPSMRQFWRQIFEDGVPTLDIPTDKARPRFRGYASLREDYKLDRAIYEKLKETGAKNGSSQFVTLLSAFSLYLYRVSGQTDHVIGVPAAGQIKSGKAKLLGHDARLLPIRCQVEPTDTFKTFSDRVMQRFFAAYENQWVSLPQLIKELNIAVDPARVPVASVMFNFDPGMRANDFQFKGVKAHHFFNHRNFETFEISINAVVEDNDMVLECAYSSDLFERSAMHERLAQLEHLMGAIAANPDMPVAQLELLPTAQVNAMDAALNSTEMNYESALCVDQLVERIAKASPERIAVEFESASLTYGQLWEKSGRIAQALLSMNLGAKPLVGVMVERTEAMLATLLGVWRAGGAYVPLDPAYPTDRLQYMVEHSEIKVVLTQDSLKDILPVQGVNFVDVPALLASEIAPLTTLAPGRSSNDIAYVIYTSGSTGKPKGVKVPQRALHNFLVTMGQTPGIKADDRVMAITTLSFDIAQLELWLPLVNGARTVVVDRATAIDGVALIKTIEEKKINFMQATPATWRVLLVSEWAGDENITALCGGEALPRELADEIVTRVGVLWNVYGPTETTVWSTLDRVQDGAITIGKPIGNTQCYVLDEQGRWVPQGVVGELWIGGDGVTDGYLNRDDLTRERFVPNRFTGKGHIYKTGDLVRLRPDGRIEFVGRNDFQVKVRGFRIELGEVQHAAARHPAVQQAVAAVKEKTPGDAHLVVYYTVKSGKKVKPSEIKDAMRGAVPDYMLPGYFVELGAMPLTNNGKVNIKGLPTPFTSTAPTAEEAAEAAAEHAALAPRTETELYLAKVWAELLGTTRILRTDRFFEQGGHSLLAIRAINRIAKDRGVKLSPKSMVLKTLEQIAIELAPAEQSATPAASTPARAAATPAKTSTPVMAASEPFFFGNPEKPKYGCFHKPVGKAADFAVLICPALGQEYMRTHWLIKTLSSTLARRGAAVLRFDYYGQGDSAGQVDGRTLADLHDSVIEAAQALRARAGTDKLRIVTFRASALIVEGARARLGDNVEIIQIDPTQSGRAFIEGLRSLQKTRWDAYPYKKTWIQSETHEEILAAVYPREALAELESLRLTSTDVTVLSSSTLGQPADWDNFLKLERVWLSPEIVRSVEKSLFGERS